MAPASWCRFARHDVTYLQGEENMGKNFEKYIGPFLLPIGLLVIVVGVLALVGEMYLAMFIPGDTPDRLNRPELWTSLGILLGVIAIIAFVSSRPKGSLGPLEKDVVIGRQPLWADELPPVDARAISGEPGTIDDLNAGYTLYAQSGTFGRVLGLLPGGTDYGKRFSGFMHVEGHGHAEKQMWIPFEAVTAVYPETQSAFLAIKGDEAESFGWTSPPESMTRGESRPASAADRVK
jgi:hypothetical protein